MVYSIRLLRKCKLMLASSVQRHYDKSFNVKLIKARVVPWTRRTGHTSSFMLAVCGTCKVSAQFPKHDVFHILFFYKAKERNKDFLLLLFCCFFFFPLVGWFLKWSSRCFNKGWSTCRNMGMCTVSGNNIQVVELPGVDLLLDSRPSHPEGCCSYRNLVH